MKKGRTLLVACAVVVLGAGGATLAWATTGADSTTINACVAKNGKVSIYPPPQKCLNAENPISWNSQGPAGPQGPQGPRGDADKTAVAGTITIAGQHFGDFGQGLKITGLSHQIVSPRDAASGLPTGKRQHKPFVITKELDKSTPLLMRSIVTNETLTSVLIGLLLPSGQPYATVKLTNASVADIQEHGSTQTVAFTYQKITWTWVDGGITAEDDWETPAS